MTRQRWLPAFVLLCCSNSFADDVAKIQIAAGASENQAVCKNSARMLDIVFKKINTPYSFECLPPERATQLFISGAIDGNTGRVADYHSVFPQAIRVEPPMFTYQMIAIGIREELHPHSWDELRDYQLAYRHGNKIMSIRFAGMSNITEVSSIKNCLLMAKTGHVDFCVGPNTETSSEPTLFSDGKLKTFIISKENA